MQFRQLGLGNFLRVVQGLDVLGFYDFREHGVRFQQGPLKQYRHAVRDLGATHLGGLVYAPQRFGVATPKPAPQRGFGAATAVAWCVTRIQGLGASPVAWRCLLLAGVCAISGRRRLAWKTSRGDHVSAGSRSVKKSGNHAPGR